MAVFSKFRTIPTTCVEYVHPWTESCSSATTVLGMHAIQESFRIYLTVYMLALIMRGRVPTQKDLKRTAAGLCISTLFLTCNAFTFPLFSCWLRKLFGNFNMLTVSFIPAFLAAYVAILVERPSRRSLLALYVTNVATETLFRMAAWRGLVRGVPHGQVIIFSISMTVLLYFFRGQKTKRDSIYGLLRFVVGPFEEREYLEKRVASSAERLHSDVTHQDRPLGKRTKGFAYRLASAVCGVYYRLIRIVKGFGKHPTCPHPFSCTFYVLEGFVKLFSLGYGLQLCLRVLMQMRRLIRRPSMLPRLLFHRNAIQLGAFLGGFSGIFKLTSCVLRRIFNKDTKYHAIPAGLLAGLAFRFFPDNTVALYVMWKSLQIIYNDSIQKGYAPELPGAIILLYSFSTAVLFHAAVLEPHNLRPSYWKFLHSLSGGRISAMDRKCLDAFGLGTSQSLTETLVKTNTHLVPFSELI